MKKALLIELAGCLLCSVSITQGQSTASAKVSVVNGSIAGIAVTDGGEGYRYNPKVNILDFNDGTGGEAVASILDGHVINITVINSGKSYSQDTFVLIDPPTRLRFQAIAGRTTWHAAKDDAIVRGGHLATFGSEAEYNEMLKATRLPHEYPGAFFLGATDENQEGKWEWVTGEPFTWSRWHPGEPNNALGGEDYLVDSGSYGWNDDKNDGRNNGYILEFDDTDGDGLLNIDERTVYFTDATKKDSDGDGYDDGLEIKYGSNPNDKYSLPDLLAAFPAVELELVTSLGIRYQIESSTDLTNWVAWGNVFMGVGGKTNVLISTRQTEMTFWRTKRVP